MPNFPDNAIVHFPDDEVKFPHAEPGGDAASEMTVIKSSLNEHGEPVVMVRDKTGSLTTFFESDLAAGKRVTAPGRVFQPRPALDAGLPPA